MYLFGKRVAYTAALSTVLFFGVVLVAHAERIDSFDADMVLHPDSSFTVTETIEYDFESAERHGIFRIIATEHPQGASRWYKERYIDIDVQSVQMDRASVPYEVDTSGGETEIKIGDPDRTVTGQHTYTIIYEVRGALFYEEDATELYWNVTGSEWPAPIESVTATLTAPDGVLGNAQTCYVGQADSTERCTATTADEGVAFTARALNPGEEVTIAQELDAGAVEEVVLERVSWVLMLFIFGPLFLIVLIISAYRIRTKHKVSLPVIAQYEPYEDMRPMYAGMLIDGVLHPHDITAGIVYLAEQGFLKIKKIDKKFLFFDMSDYEVTLQKDSAEAPGKFLHHVLALLFGRDATAGQTVSLSEIKKNMPQQRLNQKILTDLRRALKDDMHAVGYFEDSFGSTPSWRTFVTVLAVVLGVGALLTMTLGSAALGIYAAALVVVGITASIVWTRRTEKGYRAQNHLKGFKEFLSVTDKERFKFHSAPERNPETFLAYLPYAIAFGVEKEWAKVFDDITIPNPGWYDGGHAGAFSAAAFTSDMSTFSSSLASSSGSSPSSGGGSAGGGAGGGGGGSW